MFGRSWEMIQASWTVLKQDKELLLFPLVSLIGTIVVTIVMIFPLAASGIFSALASDESLNNLQIVFSLVFTFFFYFFTYTVIIFSNTALVGAAMMRMRGEDPTVRDGFRIASERINLILGYSAIAATVGVILSLIRGDEDNFVGRLVASILGTAWNVVTFLVVPVLVIERLSPIDAIKRSGTLLKQTWGEQVVGSFGMGLILFLAMLAASLITAGPIFLIASVTNSAALNVVAIVVLIIVNSGIGLIGGALDSIYRAALYNYAANGEASTYFDASLVEGAFKPKAKMF